MSHVLSSNNEETKKKYPPTDEQVKAIKFSERKESFKIIAYAGAGKTTTLTNISQHLFEMFGMKGLYLAFNKTIAEEAKTKLHPSVDCRTFHSLAYRSVGAALTSKVNFKKAYPKDLATQFGAQELNIPVDLEEYDKYINFNQSRSKNVDSGKRDGYHRFTPEMQMQCVNESIVAFCRSIDYAIQKKHIQLPEWASKDTNDQEVKAVIDLLFHYTKIRWKELTDTSNNVGITHDVYLKVWALSRPQIKADYILFDESQDADAVQLQILNAQDCPIIYVGDEHQSIYEWRGAVNAMSSLNIPQLRLTKSFRFGTDIALYANKILAMLGETVPLRGHAPIESQVVRSAGIVVPDAILCRTNKGAFTELINAIRLKDGRKYAIQANTEEIISFLTNAKKLRCGEPTDHVELDNFDSWEILVEYAELNPHDQNVSGLVKIIQEFEDIDLLINTLKDSAKAKEADCVICTAHKSKGLEWDNVKISNDFNLALLEGGDLSNNLDRLCAVHDETSDLSTVMREIKESITEMPDSELRLLYVATTRAKKELDITNIINLYKTFDMAMTRFYDRADSDVDLKAQLVS